MHFTVKHCQLSLFCSPISCDLWLRMTLQFSWRIALGLALLALSFAVILPILAGRHMTATTLASFCGYLTTNSSFMLTIPIGHTAADPLNMLTSLQKVQLVQSSSPKCFQWHLRQTETHPPTPSYLKRLNTSIPTRRPAIRRLLVVRKFLGLAVVMVTIAPSMSSCICWEWYQG